MSLELLIVLVIMISGFVALAFLIRQWISTTAQKPDQFLSEFLKSFDSRSQEQSRETRELSKTFNERLDNAARIIGQVQKNIGEFSEIGRSMRDLQEFLKSPKLRGTIGEEVLSDLITQMFPRSSFFLQYAFKSGVRVDAAIKTDAGILPIDAKFPLENFEKLVKGETETERLAAKKEFMRDIKGHIETIAQKYILPDEGTLDFALMYVPSEAVFYELVQIGEVMRFAKSKRVYPVSPTTLYAHLQTILLSFAGKQMQEKSREVFQLLRSMLSDYEKLQQNLGVLGKHVTNAYNQMSQVNQGATILGQKLTSTQYLGEKEEHA